MQTSDFDYYLPPDRIAQTPVEPRDSSRLLVLHRESGEIEHRHFRDIGDYLNAGDLLVANNSRVIPARLFGRKPTGGKVELLLLEQTDSATWKALVKGKRIRTGSELRIVDREGNESLIVGTVSAELHGAQRLITFNYPLDQWLESLGHVPLPPYIAPQLDDPERYQTVYSQPQGSAAAPTAGLHFTPDLLFSLREKGIGFETVTLHVGLDTFQPVSAEKIADHHIHEEWVEMSVESAERINKTKLAGGRIIAVGTTATRTLETAAWHSAGIRNDLRTIVTRQDQIDYCPWKPVSAYTGTTDLYIYPPYRYRVVDALITNFHLPKSSLLMLVSAFASYDQMMKAYKIAIEENYRFFSFGDAMLIV